MSMADLVAAGAPELPEGWFYRVTEDGFGGVEVQIRSQRKRWGSRLEIGVWVAISEFTDMPGALADACSRAYRDVKQVADRRSKYVALTQFLGDHDPKGGR